MRMKETRPTKGIEANHLKSWAAGFIDGEGCFTIELKRHKDGRTLDESLCPKLGVHVRRDDEGSLKRLQRAIEDAGCLYRRPARKASRHGSISKPTSECYWHSMKSLKAIVRLLDHYPLLGKKATDYALWREAVLIYTNQGRPSQERQRKLRPLRIQLQEVKRYTD